ncbi:hypothetical protein FB451DRAFT_1369813 [Mycena latifolia]|nr:hypothetical protein FB451DRAFT_1369813 [Mycena latifolia]
MDHGPRMHHPGAVPRLGSVLNLTPMVRLAMPLSATRPSNLMCDADDSQEPPKKKAKPSGHRRKGTRGPPAPTRANPWMPPSAGVSTSNVPSAPSVAANLNPEVEACFPMEDMTEDAEEELDRLEREGFARHEQSHPGPQPPASQPAAPLQATPSTADLLKQAARRSNSREYIYTGIIRVDLHSVDMFFSKREVFACDAESEDEGMDSENEEDETEPRNSARRIEPSLSGEKAWFKQPKGMPAWLYQFFRDTVQPLLFAKEGGKLLRPSIFSTNNLHAPASFWIHPVEPVVALEGYQFDPPMLYQPRVFLWLPHFFVQRLNCPNCRTGKLEKNGALTPRRITDCDSSFYIVSWVYYCRDSCKSYYHGWSQRLLDSTPAHLRLSFPAVLSRKTGLSRNVLAMLRVGNQHKMGPSGTRAMLYEMHTLRYNRLLLQYLESAFERERGLETLESTSLQSTLHVYGSASHIPPFGDFANPQGYDGFVPDASYLTSMINKAIEKDEPDADQHTSCLPPDRTDIDDSHKITKHIANEDGVPIFGALWTCMTSRYIRAQALTLTKSHEERIGPLMGIAKSAKRYGFGEPLVAYSDDPVKDKSMLCAAFPSLAENLTPIAVAHGLESLSLPATVKITYLDSISLVQDAFKSFVAALDADQQAHLCVSLDAEWNMSRRVGVSVLQIAPHLSPNTIYIIPDSSLRQCENWEDNISHRPELLNYAALDVYASRLIFEKISEKAPLECVQHDTAPGTRIAMLTREGGEIAAYGQISAVQTSTFAGIRVKTSNNSRVVDIDSVLIPAAAAILHVPPSSSSGLSLLQFDRRPPQSISAGPSAIPNSEPQLSGPPPAPQPTVVNTTIESLEEEDSDDIAPDNQDEIESDLTDETLRLHMLKSHAQAGSPSRLEDEDVFDSSPLGRGLLELLRKVSNSPDETQECYTRIKKDIFHAFHMIPLSSSHGLRAVFLRTLRDHMMRWDPVIRAKVDETCRKVFKVGFDVMLLRHPRFIKERTPRYIPPPSVLVPAIQQNFCAVASKWHRLMKPQRRAVALPILPPNTPEARKYFFSKIGSFVAKASASGKRRINYNDFAREWNRSADGKDRYYVTPDVLSAYAKSWDKTNNARASQELIAAKMDLVRQTGELFRAPSAPFPTSLIGDASVAHPRHGVIDLMATDSDGPSVPSSIDADVAISRPRITVQNPDQLLDKRRSTHSLTQPQTSAPALGSASSSHHSELNSQPPVRTAQSGESSTDVAGSIFDLDGHDPSQDYGGPPDPNLEIQTGSSSVIQRENSTKCVEETNTALSEWIQSAARMTSTLANFRAPFHARSAARHWDVREWTVGGDAHIPLQADSVDWFNMLIAPGYPLFRCRVDRSG